MYSLKRSTVIGMSWITSTDKEDSFAFVSYE